METITKLQKEVFTTTDYFLFKSIDGNRTKNLQHLNRLKKSIQENYLFTVIVVNEKYEIIDGQHRFDIISELGLPLNYIICNGYGLNEVHILNASSKNWTADDYLEGYCKLGYRDYITYKEFKDKFKLHHYETMWLLNGSQVENPKLVFYQGKFKIKNIKNAYDTIEKIKMIEPYYPEWRRRSFLTAMLTLLKNNDFNFYEFMTKLKLQPLSIKNCSTTKQCIELIETIYNYHRRNKVNLRYSKK